MARILLLASILVAIASCAKSDRQVIPIGFYSPMTGATAYFGLTVKQGIDLAIAELNSSDAFQKNQLVLSAIDDRGNPEEAQSAVARLILKDRVVAILGEASSSGSLAAAPICQQHRIPMITPTATNPKVTETGDYIFRICWIDPFQGELMARFAIQDLHSKRIAVLYDVGSDYSTGLVEIFTRTVAELGGDIVARKSFNSGDTDFSAQLTSIQSANADAVFLPVFYTEAALILRQAKALGIHADFLGSDGWDSPKLYEIGGDALDGSYFCSHFFYGDPAPVVQTFVNTFQKKYGSLPSMGSALGYDATKLLAEVLKDTRNPHEIRTRLAATKNFNGVTGKITIDEKRNARKSAVVLQIRKRTAEFVQKIEP